MHYDLTNPDASYYWLHEALQIRQGELIETYVVECHNDFDTFYEKYRQLIDKIDVENMEIVAFQVTTCNDGCSEIKKNGSSTYIHQLTFNIKTYIMRLQKST